jgi:hypothetical protein
MESDGYYYRNAYNSKGVGPMTLRDLDYLKETGDITDETKVWRQSGGQIYKLDIGRKFTKMFTFEACNHAFELIIIAITFFCTAFSMTLLDWKVGSRFAISENDSSIISLSLQNEKDTTAKWVLVLLAFVTFGLVIMVSSIVLFVRSRN